MDQRVTNGRRHWAAWGVLLLGVLFTVISTMVVVRGMEERDRIRFEYSAALVVDAVDKRFDNHVTLLRGVRAAIAAYDNYERRTFHEVIASLEVNIRHPGIRAIGYSVYIRPEEREMWEERFRQAWPDGFDFWPPGETPDFHAVLLLKPIDATNRPAIGFNMASEQLRREAMERARDTAQPVMTGQTVLVGDTTFGRAPQPGFLVYLPVYTSSATPATVEERRERLHGFVYAPFRGDDVLATLFIDSDTHASVGYAMYDSGIADADHLFHASGPVPEAVGRRPRFSTKKQLTVGGRDWTLQLWSQGPFESSANWLLMGLFPAAGLTVSLALFAVIRAQARAQHFAEEANRSKDQFLAMLSHELRTPLTPVLAAAAYWRGDTSLPSTLQHDLALVHRNVELESRLIDDLLDLTRIGRGKLHVQHQVVDLHAAIEHAVEVTASDMVESKCLDVRTRLQAVHHHVSGDPARLQQVFWNLLQNACKFTPSDGHIEVTTRNDDAGLLVVQVRDTGAGIDKKLLPRIFDAFEQGAPHRGRNGGGLGLGLAICRGLIHAHGGTLTATSDGLGKGSTFTITLKSIPAPEAVDEQDTPPAVPPRQHAILLVEDHADTAEMLARLLERFGHRLTTANSVAEARERLEAGRFDLLVSDLGLPDGSGRDVIRHAHAINPALRGIALSGYGMEEDVRASYEAGFSAHVIKPVNLDQLRAAIDGLPERDAVQSEA